jgi:hypothetical protein
MEKFMKVASQGFTKPAKVSSQGTFKSASHTFLELTQISVCTLSRFGGSNPVAATLLNQPHLLT